MRISSILFALVLLITGCAKHKNEGIFHSGRIDYKITYLENNLVSISPNMLPKKMKLEFNQEYSTNVIEGFMGIFRLNNITHFKHKRCSTLLEILNKNYIYLGKRGDEMCCFESMEDMDIKYTGETKTIAGLKCHKAIVTLNDNKEKFDVYYTYDINLSDPNITNPYKKIDGVLMEFQLSLSGLKMRFTAESFENTVKNTMEEPAFPKNSNEVTREQMAHIISKLME
ncbi:MAG: hypothetical protein JXB00_04785 [Bacteroidales bacterium]|nr:hypothetical protein [Bacteroidales bacterium]